MSVGKDMQQERLKLASELWAEEIGAEFTHTKANPFLPEQINHATTGKIPLAVIMAPRELAEVCTLPRTPRQIWFKATESVKS